MVIKGYFIDFFFDNIRVMLLNRIVKKSLLTQIVGNFVKIPPPPKPKMNFKIDDIPFEFQIPKKQPHISQKQPVNLKIGQSQVSKKLKSKLKKIQDRKRDLQSNSSIQDQYQKSQQNKVRNNIRSRNFYQAQYQKGQELLQNAPLDPYYEYQLGDYYKKLEEMKFDYDQFVSYGRDNIGRALILRNAVQAYDEKLRRGQYQNWIKYLKEYPGSQKGATPQQDPQHYAQYALAKMPQFVRRKIQLQMKIKSQHNSTIPWQEEQKVKLNEENEDDDDASAEMTGLGNITDQQLKRVQFMGLKNKFEKLAYDRQFKLPDQPPQHFEPTHQQVPQDIPSLPPVYISDYQNYYQKVVAWCSFKRYFQHERNIQHVKTFFRQSTYFNLLQRRKANNVNSDQISEQQQQWYELKPTIASLCRYYRTLPKFIQDHPGIKNIYLGLEYTSPQKSVPQKEQGLNYAATHCLPFDPITQHTVQVFASRKREYLTPFYKDKIFTMNPQHTWSIEAFLKALKEQQLKGYSHAREKQQKYHQPPQTHNHWQKDIASLPVDYYENDDGFWDQIISKKYKRYDEAQPMIRSRKHFKH